MSKLLSLFSIPYYKINIDKKLYNKSDIIKTIHYNYKINPNRNNWDSNSNLHHDNNDQDNKSFIKIDYSQLYPLYQKKIFDFLNKIINDKHKINFNFYVVNYTCMNTGQYMIQHDHIESDFTAVHYLSFNKKEHKSTAYKNTHIFSNYLKLKNSSLNKKLNTNKILNSWVCDEYSIDVQEDDFVIVPGCIPHNVPPFKNSKDLRITIVLNINLE